jgi:hypothetical protein
MTVDNKLEKDVRENEHGLIQMLISEFVPGTEDTKNLSKYIRMEELRFSQRWLWRMSSSGMWHCVDPGLSDVSEERIASIFRVEKSVG